MQKLPENFVKTILGVYEEIGQSWLDALPQILDAAAERYALTIGAPYDLSFNYVCRATRRDGTPVVLKLSPPNQEFHSEIAALRHYNATQACVAFKDVRGCVQLLEADPDAGMMIMEQIRPGKPLRGLPDDEATHIAAEVMSKLWRPLPADHQFPTVAKWAEGLQRLRADNGGGTGPLPAHLVERAEATYRELLASAPSPVLLHGDLHHDNILSATRAPYLAIDPKGLAGEPAYEVGPLFYNPQPELYQVPDLAQVLGRRLAILVEHLQMDRQRLLACAFAHSVLSSAWSLEDNDYDDGWQKTIRVAETLLQL
jgi:streptomycin 6-kinase